MQLELTAIWADNPLQPGLPKNTATQLNVPQGSDAVVKVTFINELGNPVVLGVGESMTLYVRQAFNQPTLFSKAAVATSDE